MEWRSVVGYEGFYEVSEFGDVRRLPHAPGSKKKAGLLGVRFLGPVGHPRLSVMLSRPGKRGNVCIHRLVARAFLGDPPPNTEVDHVDGNWFNNDYRNLEYVTRLDNMKRAVALGLRPRGERHGIAKLTDEDVRLIRASPAIPASVLATMLGVACSTVCRARRKQYWSHVS